MYELKNCKWCGCEFIKIHNRQEYCSKEHAQKANAQIANKRERQFRHENKKIRYCEICEKNITQETHGNAKLCKDCREKVKITNTGKCLFCGDQVEDRRRKFCNDSHKFKYYRQIKKNNIKKRKAAECANIKELTKYEKDICKKLRLSYGEIDTIKEERLTIEHYIKLYGWKYGMEVTHNENL